MRSVHVTLDEYAVWKREKDRGWRDDWEQAAAGRGLLIDAMKVHLVDRGLADIQERDVEALQKALLATGMAIDRINAATSLLGDACRHAGSKPWVVHSLSTPEEVREARAQLDEIHDEQLRQRSALLDSFRSSSRKRRRDGWRTLEEARELCADLLREAGVGSPTIAAGTRLETRFVALPGPTAIGASRIGGAPDGPRDFQWPKVNGTPLAFLLQLDLATLRKEGGESELPDRGRLLFFYDLEGNPWGGSPDDAGRWKVVYDRSESPAPIPWPSSIPDELRSRPTRLTLYRVPALLPRWSPAVLALPEATQDALYDLNHELDRFDTRHKVLGVADPLQGWEMDLECQLASNGLDSSETGQRADELAKGAAEWTLLLQLDSDYPIDLVLGRGGRLFFWIRRDDLRSSNFDNVWVIFQTT
jgi:uncharacterized protein YwqG